MIEVDQNKETRKKQREGMKSHRSPKMNYGSKKWYQVPINQEIKHEV